MLAFPEPGLDDSAAYQGYQTRFYRDSRNNTVQIYIQPQTSRVVLLWANAANESAGFTLRDGRGRPARVTWDGEVAEVRESGNTRTIEYRLVADAPRIQLGWFLLGSMRVERDFVYARRHEQPFTAPAFRVAEESLLVNAVATLPAEERQRHLSLLQARDLLTLEGRLDPTIVSQARDSLTLVRVERHSLDGKNRLRLELLVNPETRTERVNERTISLFTSSAPVHFTVRVTTDAAPLTPLSRNLIFNREFLGFLAESGAATDSAAVIRHRRLERQVRGVELLSSQEKLMAGLPNFATYFGRDMMMTALMMRPIWSPAMAEHVIASVLRKLGPQGQVSHEEALGGQAIREHAVLYDSLIAEYLDDASGTERAEPILRQAADLLRDLQKTRENYHMIDDEFQLPVLAAWYLADSTVPSSRKRVFLLEKRDGISRLTLLLRELALVASLTRPYVMDQKATNLVSFPLRDSTHWRSASWRDSDAGYAGGRFAMDINVIWVPKALESIASIFHSLQVLQLNPQALAAGSPDIQSTPLGHYLRYPSALRRAIDTWKGARRHFTVTLAPAEIQRRVSAKLAWLSSEEQRYWQSVLSQGAAMNSSLTFLVLSLDAAGRPIPIVNTDPATALFLNHDTGRDLLREEVAPFLRPYPVGLLVNGLGPVVANDAYAAPQVWERFKTDHYHGPRVVWGREVNLLLLGLASQKTDTAIPEVDRALRRTLAAVNASGLQHNELWSYEIKGGKLLPVRYGTSSDVQLWNTTNLVVQYVLSQRNN